MSVEWMGNEDLFKSGADVLVNATNCVGVMGGGIALEFKIRYPEMFEEYVEACKNGTHRPGILHFWQGENIIVCNLATKDHWKDPSEYTYVNDGLVALNKWAQFHPDTTVAVPKLGCGLGGLEWSVVQALCGYHLDKPATRFWIYGDKN